MTYSGLLKMASGGRGGGASGTTSSSGWDGAASSSGDDAWDLSTKQDFCNWQEKKMYVLI